MKHICIKTLNCNLMIIPAHLVGLTVNTEGKYYVWIASDDVSPSEISGEEYQATIAKLNFNPNDEILSEIIDIKRGLDETSGIIRGIKNLI